MYVYPLSLIFACGLILTPSHFCPQFTPLSITGSAYMNPPVRAVDCPHNMMWLKIATSRLMVGHLVLERHWLSSLSFTRTWRPPSKGWKTCVLSRFGGVRLFVIPWTVAHQAPLPMGLSRQEDWSGSLFPSPGDLFDPGIELTSPSLAGSFFLLLLFKKKKTTGITWEASKCWRRTLLSVRTLSDIQSFSPKFPKSRLVTTARQVLMPHGCGRVFIAQGPRLNSTRYVTQRRLSRLFFVLANWTE